jgi:hypothetical protein
LYKIPIAFFVGFVDLLGGMQTLYKVGGGIYKHPPHYTSTVTSTLTCTFGIYSYILFSTSNSAGRSFNSRL